MLARLRDRLRRTPVRAVVLAVRRGRERVRWALERTRAWGAWHERRQAQALQEWRRRPTSGSPPHLVKQAIVKEYARRHELRTLVETGTLHGDMLQGTRTAFTRQVSIELAPHLARRAAQRFAGQTRTRVLEGDSEQLLPEVLATLDGPALFWLDAHYSADDTARGRTDTPIEAELQAVLRHPVAGHVVLIDDVRSFGRGDYPAIETVERLVAELGADLSVEVADDILRIVPAVPPQTSS